MTSWLDNEIAVHGSTATIKRRTAGSENDYGDIEYTWAYLSSTEKVWIQPIQLARANPRFEYTLAGVSDETTHVGYMGTDTTIQERDILADTYVVLKKIPISIFGGLIGYEAHLQQLEEGD